MLHIPHVHAAYAAWAAIMGIALVVIVIGGLGGLLRRNLARLLACAAFGAAVAFGVTGWFGGQPHARVAMAARAAAHPAAHQAAITVNGMLTSAFTVTFALVTILALAVTSLARRRRPAARRGGRPAARSW
jgi:hypothetical protein